MTTIFHQTLVYLFPKNCFEELLVRFNVLDPECSRIVLSRFLGLGIILGSVLVKLPQLIKIIKARSGQGVSFLSQFLELVATTATGAYAYSKLFPFSAWGEALFIAIQTTLICGLILEFQRNRLQAIAFLLLYISVTGCIALRLVPMDILYWLQAFNIPIGVSGRVIQIRENHRNKSTGQLSFLTVFLMFAGCLARIFTSIQETGDSLLIGSFVVASVTNGILLSQIFYYWTAPAKEKFH